MGMSEKRTVLFTSCMLLVVGLFSMDLYNPSLPAISADLHVGQALARALVVAYLAGFAISQLFYGPLSDSLGRKKIIFISLSLAVIGNVLTAFATTGHQLLLYRFFTGIGAGGCPAISRAILRDTFHTKKDLTQAFTIYAMASQISPSLAPILGGFIEQHFSWQINFIALGIISTLALTIIAFVFKETNNNIKKFNFTATLASYRELLLHKKFVAYTLMSSLVFAYTIGYYTINPFVFQNEYAFSPLQNGIIYFFYSFALFFGSFTTKKLTHRYSSESVLHFGILGLLLTTGIMFLITQWYSSVFIVIAFSSIVGLFCGVSAPILISLSVLPFPEKAGAASALQGSIKMVGTALVLGILLFLHIDTGVGLSIMFLGISAALIPFLLFIRRQPHSGE